jgi:hypothetical protein
MHLPQFVRWATGMRWQWKVFIPVEKHGPAGSLQALFTIHPTFAIRIVARRQQLTVPTLHTMD